MTSLQMWLIVVVLLLVIAGFVLAGLAYWDLLDKWDWVPQD